MTQPEPRPKNNRLSEAPQPMGVASKSGAPIPCAECGREVDATQAGRFKRRYCSTACKARAYRRAHAAENNARQRERRAARRAELGLDPVPLSPNEAAMMAASAE